MSMDELDIDFLEKVKLPEYAGYGWSSAVKDMRALIQEVRRLRKQLEKLSERSDEPQPA
jgi:hypothetical protein